MSYEKFVKENECSSQEACRSLLCSLHKPIEDDFKAGKYTRPGGYEIYKSNIDLLYRNYSDAPGKGVKVSINSVNFSALCSIEHLL